MNIQKLHKALLYLNMQQLKTICKRYTLDTIGNKGDLIERIITFIANGKKISVPSLPDASKAQQGKTYPLAPKTLILSGSYTNNLATRNFFKKLIGDHFHFTAYGNDWLTSRWMSGNPPTYQEFADYWENERVQRTQKKPNPKKEWAYINFLQDFYTQHPKAQKSVAMAAWKTKQQEMVELVWSMLNIK